MEAAQDEVGSGESGARFYELSSTQSVDGAASAGLNRQAETMQSSG